MAIMKSCCCFSNMKSACLAAGIYTIVIAGLGLFSSLYMGNGNANHMQHSENYWYLMIPCALIYSALLIGGITLIVGSRRGYHGRHLIMAFIVIMAIYLVIVFGIIIAGIVMMALFSLDFPLVMLIPIVMWLVMIIFLVLSFLSGISLYQQLREEGPDGPLSTPSKQGVTIVVGPDTYPPTGEFPEDGLPSDKKCTLGEMSHPPPYSPA